MFPKPNQSIVRLLGIGPYIGLPIPGRARRLFGPKGIKPSHQNISPLATPGRSGLVFRVENSSKIIGRKLVGIPGICEGSPGTLLIPRSDIYTRAEVAILAGG